MLLPQTYLAALLLMILSMLCWGSWANTYKLAGNWRFELFYFDYAFGVLLASLLLAFTLGTYGYDGFTFVDDFMHAGKRQWLMGFTAGVIFNLANMLLVAAIAVAGMAVAFPIGIGTALIIGVVWNYTIKPQGNAMLLFSGCGIIVAAIVVDAMAYRALAVIRHEALAKAGKSRSTRRPVPVKGVAISLVAGILMGLFYPLVEKAQAGEVGLGPYSVAVIFAVGVFFSTFVFNMFLMNLPVEGEPLELGQYFQGSRKQHALGWLGGALWCGGAVASFVAASAPDNVHIGPAVSYAIGQGATMVSALWGILVWKEFKGADMRVNTLVVLMLVLFVAGLTMVSVAPLYPTG